MRFDIVTIFPKVIEAYCEESIIKRAQKKDRIKIYIHDLRKFSQDKHRKVDDRPYGGGAGMVLMADPILRAIRSIKKKKRTKIIITSARGKGFTQAMARQFASRWDQIILICGHYEGIDERVKTVLKAEEISIGPYILTGGELPAMTILDAVVRHVPGVLGKWESREEIKGSYPVYTRPETIKNKGKKYTVPPVLLAGNHQAIEVWRKNR